jgi:hypothetical protein
MYSDTIIRQCDMDVVSFHERFMGAADEEFAFCCTEKRWKGPARDHGDTV